MGATENANRIRDGYRAFNSGDVAALTDLFADDIVWHFPGTSKLSGEHVGRDATLGALGAYGAAGQGTLQANLVDVMAGGRPRPRRGHHTPPAGGGPPGRHTPRGLFTPRRPGAPEPPVCLPA